MERCEWCLCNDKMVKYHDEEWGVPLHDDRKQFEFLMMEAVIYNAGCFLKIREEFGSFSEYLWGFSKGKTMS